MGHVNPDFPYDPYEALGIVQEECAELIQDISKIRRSGVEYPRHHGHIENWNYAQNEFWDLLVVAEIAGFDLNVPDEYKYEKLKRLKEWSNLF